MTTDPHATLPSPDDGAGPPQVVVLAAGFGRRLGGGIPKALVRLVDGRTILDQQLDHLRAVLGAPSVHVVVGHKAALVLEAHPDVLFVYNPAFEFTNTAKSLLCALRLCPPGDVLWLNGDVVFDPRAVERLVRAAARTRTSCVAVDRSSVGEEEVKYSLADDGHLDRLSKQVQGALGEAVGLNLVRGEHRAALEAALGSVGDEDYFERAVEVTIERDGLRWAPVDVTDLFAVEVDFPEDLDRANSHLTSGPPAG